MPQMERNSFIHSLRVIGYIYIIIIIIITFYFFSFLFFFVLFYFGKYIHVYFFFSQYFCDHNVSPVDFWTLHNWILNGPLSSLTSPNNFLLPLVSFGFLSLVFHFDFFFPFPPFKRFFFSPACWKILIAFSVFVAAKCDSMSYLP